MSPAARAGVALLVQWAVVGAGAYLALSESALPGASTAARVAIGVLCAVVAVLIGEVARVRLHMTQLIAALRAGGAPGIARDDKAAVDVLVRALSSDDPDVRIKAHKNLVRLTGQAFTIDPERWQAWWKDARDGFVGRDVGAAK